MGLIDKELHESLGLIQFRNFWRCHFQNLKIGSRGSDFCDYCVAMSSSISEIAGIERDELLKQIQDIKTCPDYSTRFTIV